MLKPGLRKYWMPLILAFLGLIFFVYGLISLLGTNKEEPKLTFVTENAQAASEKQINVDVEGAVINPGVHKLKITSILQDALIASGGLSEDADRHFIAKYMNLASKLSEGQKIYIPVIGEEPQAQDVLSEVTEAELININIASESQLDTLSGIGPVTAQKIIKGRPYTNINQLIDKKIVSQSVFTKIKERITVN